MGAGRRYFRARLLALITTGERAVRPTALNFHRLPESSALKSLLREKINHANENQDRISSLKPGHVEKLSTHNVQDASFNLIHQICFFSLRNV